MEEMANAAETIERLKIIQLAEECKTLEELIQKLKAKE